MPGAETDPRLIEAIPPELLKVITVAQPPPGVVPNFEHPATRGPDIIGVVSALLLVAIICFVLRIYTRIKIARRWKWDDITITLGFVLSIVYYGFVLDGVINGAFGKHEYETYLDEALSRQALRAGVVNTMLVTPSLGLIKGSLFIQYYDLFSPLRWVRIAIWIGAIISCLFYGVVTVAALVLNIPRAGESYLRSTLSRHALLFAEFSIPTGVVGTFIDWYLLILPIPAVIGLNLSTPKKIGVIFVFMTGGVAAIASTINLYYRVDLQIRAVDSLYKVGYVWMLIQVEQFAGIIASSMPTIRHFFVGKGFSTISFIPSLKSGLTSLWSKRSLQSHQTNRTRPPDPWKNGFEGINDCELTEPSNAWRNKLAAQEYSSLSKLEHSKIHVTRDVCVEREVHDHQLRS